MNAQTIASIFGMPPREQQEPRQAFERIMTAGMSPATVERFVPKRIDETPEQTPSATSLANVISSEYGIEPAHAIRWLAERADEFKQLNEG
jgi:hypothetical protein